MGKLIAFLGCLVIIAIIAKSAESVECPLASKVTTCSPKCVQDSECSTLGGKCCRNICNAKSCLMANQGSNSGSSGYKGSSSGAGSYCGNVKCNSYEKCELDRSTKRMKCVRS